MHHSNYSVAAYRETLTQVKTCHPAEPSATARNTGYPRPASARPGARSPMCRCGTVTRSILIARSTSMPDRSNCQAGVRIMRAGSSYASCVVRPPAEAQVAATRPEKRFARKPEEPGHRMRTDRAATDRHTGQRHTTYPASALAISAKVAATSTECSGTPSWRSICAAEKMPRIRGGVPCVAASTASR